MKFLAMILSFVVLGVSAETVNVAIKGMSCQGCVSSITEKLQETKKCDQVKVSLEKREATFVTKTGSTISDDEIKSAVKKAGYEVTGIHRQ
jgi:copper chaperone